MSYFKIVSRESKVIRKYVQATPRVYWKYVWVTLDSLENIFKRLWCDSTKEAIKSAAPGRRCRRTKTTTTQDALNHCYMGWVTQCHNTAFQFLMRSFFWIMTHPITFSSIKHDQSKILVYLSVFVIQECQTRWQCIWIFQNPVTYILFYVVFQERPYPLRSVVFRARAWRWQGKQWVETISYPYQVSGAWFKIKM